MTEKMLSRIEFAERFARDYHTADCFSGFTQDEVHKGCAFVTCLMGEIMGATDRGEEFDLDSVDMAEIGAYLDIQPDETDNVSQVAHIFANMLYKPEAEGCGNGR